MRDLLKRFFGKATNRDAEDGSRAAGHDVRIATCALFLELARIDEAFTASEARAILSIMQDRYGLSREDADALIQAADDELKESVDLWQFARQINENYSTEEKIDIIETLWRIVYVDGKLDPYENHLMHKLEQLLRLTHKQLIDAKLRVLHGS